MSVPQEFLNTVPISILNTIAENREYENYRFQDELNSSSTREAEQKRKELKKLQIDLDIVKAQEGEVNTTEEEGKVKYWKEEREREIQKHRTKIQAVEEQLARMKQSAFESETFYNQRVNGAEENLERKKLSRSKPRIRLEMKIADIEKFFEDKNKAYLGHIAYTEAKKEFNTLYAQYKKTKERQYYESLSNPPPKITPVVSYGKRVAKRGPKTVADYPQRPLTPTESEPCDAPSDA